MSGYKKKWYEPQTRQPRQVCYKLLYIDLGDGILCFSSLNHNIQRKEWCLSAMDKMPFEVKKYWKCNFQRFEDPNVKVSPFTAHHGGTSGDTGLANSKGIQSLRKNGYRQKYLDKSLIFA